MSEPKRIRDDGDDRIRRIIMSAREDEPAPELLAAVALQLPAASAAKGAAAVSAFGAKVWVAVGIATAMVGGGLWWVAARASSGVPAAPAVRVAPAASSPVALPQDEPAPVAPVPAPPLPPARAVRERTPLQAPPEPVADLPAAQPAAGANPGAELELVNTAFDALREGDAALALQLAARHRDAYPNGAFAEERDVIVIEATLRLGRRDDARALADIFFSAHPQSSHRRRVEALLAR